MFHSRIKIYFLHGYTKFHCFWQVFIKVSNHAKIIKMMHHKDQGAVIRGPNTRVFQIGVKVAYNLEVVVLKVDTLHASLMSIRVSLVGSFISHFRLPMEGKVAIVIILSKVLINLLHFGFSN